MRNERVRYLRISDEPIYTTYGDLFLLCTAKQESMAIHMTPTRQKFSHIYVVPDAIIMAVDLVEVVGAVFGIRRHYITRSAFGVRADL